MLSLKHDEFVHGTTLFAFSTGSSLRDQKRLKYTISRPGTTCLSELVQGAPSTSSSHFPSPFSRPRFLSPSPGKDLSLIPRHYSPPSFDSRLSLDLIHASWGKDIGMHGSPLQQRTPPSSAVVPSCCSPWTARVVLPRDLHHLDTSSPCPSIQHCPTTVVGSIWTAPAVPPERLIPEQPVVTTQRDGYLQPPTLPRINTSPRTVCHPRSSSAVQRGSVVGSAPSTIREAAFPTAIGGFPHSAAALVDGRRGPPRRLHPWRD